MRKIVAKITLDNRVCIIQAHPESIDFMAKFFTVMDTSECWQRGKFVKELAKPVCFITRSEQDPTGAMLPIGLLPTLEKILKKAKASYKVNDERTKETFDISDDILAKMLLTDDNPIELRDYQLEALHAMFDNKNGVIKAGTGAGKTEMINAWCKFTEKKTLIFFKNIKLARDTLKRMKKAGMDAGIVQGKLVDENHNIVMATVQSAHKLERTDYEAVIVDECHNASQERYQEVLKRWDFEYRYGFSATPFNKKNKLKTYKVKAWLGDEICNIPAKHLIEQGYLAKPIITFIKVGRVINNVKRQKTEKLYDKKGNELELPEFDITDDYWFGNIVEDENGRVVKRTRYWYEQVERVLEPDAQWMNVERSAIVSNVYRNKMIKTLANTLPGTVLALVKYVESHGEKLHEVMDNALFLSGQNKNKERDQAVEMLEANEIKTIIASTIFDEGISIDNIYNVILCGGGQSYEKTLQRIGRGMRLHTDEQGKDKKTVRVYDFYDETHPILERHSKERIKYCEEEGYEVRIKEI